jgi:hypothetical protein
MATVVLSAAGAAIGGAMGGSVLGLSTMAVGRFVGAAAGRAIDQRLMGRQLDQRIAGQGAETVEVGRLDRFRLTGAGEGQPITQVYGRMRVGGHVIWATEFKEELTVTQEPASGGSTRTTHNYSYTISLAIALCEGEITGVHRAWADGVEIPLRDHTIRVYPGTETQMPDPLMEAIEGAGQVPAYRGTAYIVIENLELARFGNRIPQFSFEVTRPEMADAMDVPRLVHGVALMPGTGEYSLATEPVYMGYAANPDQQFGVGEDGAAVANVNSPSEAPDFNTSLDQMTSELPELKATSLVVSWFGDDLRCEQCQIKPKVEQREFEAKTMPWSVAGLTRGAADLVALENNRPVYGGTPTDLSVIQSIRRMKGEGLAVMYYPFILMDQMAGNGLPDPWSSNSSQAPLPWRGRITLAKAPGQPGSTDKTASAQAEVAAFFGTASAAHFSITSDTVIYSGPAEWGYRRFILHQAALCAAAGGVDSFCIGSEMRSLTTIRDNAGFPAVSALIALAAECRAILGPHVKIGYAADWSEYFGYHPTDGSNDLYFHLDPLWADANIDFVGIDNYMPLADWRECEDHLDASWGSDHKLEYLRANVEGGEGYDWYYASDQGRKDQTRVPITDGAYGEDWVWRYKDIRNWWQNPHHNRIAGVRQSTATSWQPKSKPIWFTEVGCAAVDKGANQPNKFLDPKSSESSLPYFSNGLRNEAMQHAFLQAILSYWSEPGKNPYSDVYNGPMLDLNRTFIWAWDARPYPWFPGNDTLWSDGPNYERGHWISGRASGRSLASIVREICHASGVTEIDTTDLHGFVRGYVVPQVGDARQALQPLMLAYAFDAIERDGKLIFKNRTGRNAVDLTMDDLALSDEIEGDLHETRAAEAEQAGRVRLGFVLAGSDHQIASEEAVLPDDETHGVAASELSLLMTRGEGRQTAERWLAEGRIARDTMRFALPPSQLQIGAGDVVRLPTKSGPTLARVDRVEVMDHQVVEAVRIEPDIFKPTAFIPEDVSLRPHVPSVPVASLFMDLPMMSGGENEIAPHVAAVANPWPGAVAIYDAGQDADYQLNVLLGAKAIVGVTETPLYAAQTGLIDRGDALRIRMPDASLASITDDALLSGGNLLAIGDGTANAWELFQFRDAQLIGNGIWEISHRLRGQAGSDALMPAVWPAGSLVVVMNGAVSQIGLAASQRLVARHYRIGPAQRPYSDPTYEHQNLAFEGNGLRPYRPAHLRVRAQGGDLHVTWIRRTRIDGDPWELYEVPLGEDSETYLVRVVVGGQVVRETQTHAPEWIYSAGLQAADNLSGSYELHVAQVSARYGPGPFAKHIQS